MSSFPAHSYSFHLIKLLFVCCWIERKCGEWCSQYIAHQIFMFFQGYNTQYTKLSWGWLGEAKVLCIIRAFSWYWLTVGQGLLSLQQVRIEGNVFISSVSSLSFIFVFLPCPSLSSPLLSSIFFLSLGHHTKWPTRVDVSLNPITELLHIKHSHFLYMFCYPAFAGCHAVFCCAFIGLWRCFRITSLTVFSLLDWSMVDS